jgi:hypothetical protein
MTNINEALAKLNDESKEIRQKADELWKDNINQQYDGLKERKQISDMAQNMNVDGMSVQKIEEAQADSKHYLENAKNCKVFINNDFKGKVSNFGKNIILIGAKSGQGKSTTTANLAYHDLIQGGRPLVITNEEAVSDVYNRVTCLIRGWNYVEHEFITAEQAQIFNDMMPKLAQRMTVIDDNYCMKYGSTTTLEGITTIFDKLLTSTTKYTSIILDYYQNIDSSLNNPSMENYKVQENFVQYIDQFKNKYMAPVIVLSQQKEGKDLPFKEAIEGRKIIYNKATCVVELVAERDLWRSGWKIHKSRFSKAIGQTIYTGFEKGKYTPYTAEFRNKVELRKTQEEQNKLLKGIFVEKANE